MRRKIVFFLLSVFALFICFSMGADKKDRKWLDSLIELSVPAGAGSAASLAGRWGGIDQSAHLDIAIHNINAHLQKIARLRYQGLTEFHIGPSSQKRQHSHDGLRYSCLRS